MSVPQGPVDIKLMAASLWQSDPYLFIFILGARAWLLVLASDVPVSPLLLV